MTPTVAAPEDPQDPLTRSPDNCSLFKEEGLVIDKSGSRENQDDGGFL